MRMVTGWGDVFRSVLLGGVGGRGQTYMGGSKKVGEEKGVGKRDL